MRTYLYCCVFAKLVTHLFQHRIQLFIFYFTFSAVFFFLAIYLICCLGAQNMHCCCCFVIFSTVHKNTHENKLKNSISQHFHRHVKQSWHTYTALSASIYTRTPYQLKWKATNIVFGSLRHSVTSHFMHFSIKQLCLHTFTLHSSIMSFFRTERFSNPFSSFATAVTLIYLRQCFMDCCFLHWIKWLHRQLSPSSSSSSPSPSSSSPVVKLWRNFSVWKKNCSLFDFPFRNSAALPTLLKKYYAKHKFKTRKKTLT